MALLNAELLAVNMFEWIAIASLKSTPLIILVFTLNYFFGKFFSATSRHILWMTILISLTIPLGWDMDIDSINKDLSASKNHSTITISNLNNQNSIEKNHQALTSSSTATPQPFENVNTTHSSQTIGGLDLVWLFTLIWLTGVIALLAVTLIEIRRYHYIKKRSDTFPNPIMAILKECQLHLGIKQTIKFIHSSEIQSPIVVGWINPSIIFPSHLVKSMDTNRATYILLHELGHIKRHDILFNWIVSLVTITHWFNPFVWLAVRQMRISMEAACDALVLARLPKTQHTHYGETLIELSGISKIASRSINAVGILENHTELLERLKMIKQFTPMSLRKQALFGLIFLGTAFASFAQPSTTSPSIPTEKTSGITESSTITLQDFAAQTEKILGMDVFVGQQFSQTPINIKIDAASLDYPKLLSQLRVNGFTAIKSTGHIDIIHLSEIRYATIPVVEKGEKYLNDEYVTEYVPLEKSCIEGLLPVLRPLIPKHSHLGFNRNPQFMLITDSYGNIQRIKAMIKTIESNIDSPEDCSQGTQTTSDKK